MYTYKRATAADLALLIQTRIVVLRAANQLPEDTDMKEVEEATGRYYTRAFADDANTTYLVFDGEQVVGTGSISYYAVMPTYHNPSGQKAYIMNIYTAPAYRRQGIARETLRLLVEDAKHRGITAISLESTGAGRALYTRFGFVPAENEMELPVE